MIIARFTQKLLIIITTKNVSLSRRGKPVDVMGEQREKKARDRHGLFLNCLWAEFVLVTKAWPTREQLRLSFVVVVVVFNLHISPASSSASTICRYRNNSNRVEEQKNESKSELSMSHP